MPPSANHATLEAHDLECVRDDQILFSQLSFILSPGHILQIEGINGSGKTSLLRILCGLALADSGQVYWNGNDIQHSKIDYFSNMTYIGHSNGVKNELTPIENLHMACALSRAHNDTNLYEALEKVGLYGYEDTLCRSLSAGQHRRVALARLLILDAPLWILDEPLTALDKQAHDFVQTLLTEHSTHGGSVILSSHQTMNFQTDHISTITLD